MRIKTSFIIVFIVFILAAGTVLAESPREQLKQMVEQLQKSPNDNALREKIIKLARELKPAPAVPEEAERRMARGTAAFEDAKSVADYRDAAKEFEQATLAAPWYGDAYFNLGVAQDKAENYEAALRSLKLAQLVSPDSKEIRALIYKVEYRKEANAPEVAASKEHDRDKALIRSLNGARYSYMRTYQSVEGSVSTHTFDIRGNEVIWGSSFVAGQEQRQKYPWQILDEAWHECQRYPLNGRQFTMGKGMWDMNAGPMTGTISENGNSIEFCGNGSTMIFRRER